MVTPAQRYALEFKHLDRDGSGKLEAKQLGPKAFAAMNKSKDTVVDAAEFDAYSGFAEDRFVRTGGVLDDDGGVTYDNRHPLVMPLRYRHADNARIEAGYAARKKLDERNFWDFAGDVGAFIVHSLFVPFILIVAGVMAMGGDGVTAEEIFLPKRMREVNSLKRQVKDIEYSKNDLKAQWETIASQP